MLSIGITALQKWLKKPGPAVIRLYTGLQLWAARHEGEPSSATKKGKGKGPKSNEDDIRAILAVFDPMGERVQALKNLWAIIE